MIHFNICNEKLLYYHYDVSLQIKDIASTGVFEIIIVGNWYIED